jgi:hypothetical protein
MIAFSAHPALLIAVPTLHSEHLNGVKLISGLFLSAFHVEPVKEAVEDRGEE